MAPKKDNVSLASHKDDPQFYKDFEQKLYSGYQAQKTELDKICYILELAAMERDLTDISGKLGKPDAIDREDYDSDEEYREAVKEAEEQAKLDYLSDEERKELGFTNQDQAKKLTDIVSDAIENATRITSRTEEKPIWNRASWESCGKCRSPTPESISRSCRTAIC